MALRLLCGSDCSPGGREAQLWPRYFQKFNRIPGSGQPTACGCTAAKRSGQCEWWHTFALGLLRSLHKLDSADADLVSKLLKR